MSETTTIDQHDLANSQLSATATSDPSGLTQAALANVKTPDGRSRMWRVTLGRLNRRDNHPPAVKNAPVDPANPVYVSQAYGYAAADVPIITSIPPRRSNPVLGGLPADIDPAFVEIAFGMEANMPNRLLAHWPRQGASIDVPGAFVQVWGGVSVHGLVLDQDTLAQFTATITPSDGGTTDADELSLTQNGATGTGSGVIVAMATSTRLTTLNPVAGAGAPQVAMPASVGVWSSSWINNFHRPMTMSAHSRAALVLEARLDQWWNPTIAAWEPLADNVGVIMPPATTINAMETAILAAAAGRLQIAVVSPNPASTVTATGGVNNYVVALPLAGVNAAVFYVPDFARRVKVVAAELIGASGFVGANMYKASCDSAGQPTTSLCWLDDRGNQVDVDGQGGVDNPGVGFPQTSMATPWHDVPAAAVVLLVFLESPDGEITVSNRPVFAHWRIAP